MYVIMQQRKIQLKPLNMFFMEGGNFEEFKYV